MKFNEKIVALAAAAAVIFWHTLSSLFFMVMPEGFFRVVLAKIPVHLVSIMLINGILTFISVFLMVFTAAYLYNRWTR